MRTVVKVVAGLVALVIVIALVLPLLVNANSFKPALESALTKTLGRTVTVGALSLSVFSGAVTASDLVIADDPAYEQKPFLTARSLKVSAALLPLIFSRELSATGIVIDEPRITMLQAPSGAWNYAGLGAGNDPPNEKGLTLSVKTIEVTNGQVTIGKLNSETPPLIADKVNAQLMNFSTSSVMPFSLTANLSGGGQLSAQGTAGPMHMGNVTLTPAQVSLKISRVDIAVAGMIEGETGMGGIITLDGNAKSDGQNADFTGKIQAEQLKLVKGGAPAKKPVEVDFALRQDLNTRRGSVTQGDLHIGSAVVHVTGTYAPLGQATVLNMNIAGSGMPVQDLESILPAVNVVLPAGSSLAGGTSQVQMALTGTTARLMAAGSFGVYKTTLRGFDIGANLSEIEKLAGVRGGPNTEIDTLRANVKASQAGGAELDHINLVVPSIGDITGSGTVSSSNQLDFRLSATVHAGGLLAVAGKTAIPVAVRGTAANPVFVPDVKALATQQVKNIGSTAESAVSGVLGGLLGGKKK